MRGVVPRKVKKQMGLKKRMNRLAVQYDDSNGLSAGYFASDLLAVCRAV